MIKKTNYINLCWWCGKKADTREHIYKKTDILKTFGKVPKLNNFMPVVIRNGEQLFIQGADSKHLKYKSSNLCEYCNTNKSSKMDKSYDLVIDYIIQNHESLLIKDHLDFFSIFGQNAKVEKLNFIRYVIKHACCRIASSGYEISTDIIDFLDYKTNKPNHFFLQLFIRLEILALQQMKNLGPFLELLPLLGEQDRSGQCFYLHSGYSFNSFHIKYLYDTSLTEVNFPGIWAYHQYPIIVLNKIHSSNTTMKIDAPIMTFTLDQENFIGLAYNKEQYNWHKKHLTVLI